MASPTEQAEFTRRLRETVVAAVLGVFALLALLWALEQLRALLVLVLFSLFCGFALEPPVNALARRGWGRGRATLAVFAGVTVVVGGATAGELAAARALFEEWDGVFSRFRAGSELNERNRRRR